MRKAAQRLGLQMEYHISCRMVAPYPVPVTSPPIALARYMLYVDMYVCIYVEIRCGIVRDRRPGGLTNCNHAVYESANLTRNERDAYESVLSVPTLG